MQEVTSPVLLIPVRPSCVSHTTCEVIMQKVMPPSFPYHHAGSMSTDVSKLLCQCDLVWTGE